MSTYENKQAVDFLLGRLDGDERIEFEEGFVTDKQVYQELLQTENELIDDYVSGHLNEDDRERFKARFFANDRQRRKVMVANALMAYSSEAANSAPVPGIRDWFASLFSFQTAFAAAAAAILICVIGGVLFFSSSQEGEFRASSDTAERDVIPAAPLPAASTSAENEIKKDPSAIVPDGEHVAQTPKQYAEQHSPAVPKVQKETAKTSSALAVVSTIILRPGLTRGSTDQLSTADHKKTGATKLKMEVPSDAGEFQRYVIIVETVAGDQIWNRTVQTKSGSVSTAVPNRKLPKGDYVVTLKGVAANGTADTLNEYTFTVR